ncbi:MAG: GNAT family N-acetyltransferase [Candidatus Limivivens sp.]|nr:GNAT family N-acetyltransferase [Candidatus Limivivens sp.]
MEYRKTVILKDGTECLLRNGEDSDAEAVYRCFQLTHGETENLLSYPEENSFDISQEGQFLLDQKESENAVEICAFLEGRLAGTAGIGPVGKNLKVKHRAEFGVSIEKSFWGRGIGRALTEACIECARKAGYLQLELDVVSTNRNAAALYKSVGFVEYGRNPRGFCTRSGEWQELILMRLELV